MAVKVLDVVVEHRQTAGNQEKKELLERELAKRRQENVPRVDEACYCPASVSASQKWKMDETSTSSQHCKSTIKSKKSSTK